MPVTEWLPNGSLQTTYAPNELIAPTPIPSPPVPPTPLPPDPPPPVVSGPQGDKPTELSTGPRLPLTDVTVPTTGLTLSAGIYTGKRFKGLVTARPGVKLVDCEVWGLKVTSPSVSADHCDILGWFSVATGNLDPTQPVFTGTFCKFVGAKDNDLMHLGASVWGDGTRLVNTLLEDCLLVSPYAGKVGAHFDLLQFGGGQNSTFRRTAMLYTATTLLEGATNYVNNGILNKGVVFEDLWIDGGPVGYVLQGPMTVTRAIIARSAKHYDFVYPSSDPTHRPTLVDVYDDAGNPIS